MANARRRNRTPTILDREEYADEMIRRAKEYINQVVDGEVPVGELEHLAVERYLRDRQSPNYWFDENGPDRVFQFFSLLRQTHGQTGQLMLAGWQCFVIWCLFGFMYRQQDEDGAEYFVRRFKIAYLQVAKKNGKTTFCAGIALYLLRYDEEPGPKIFAAATKRDQAKILSKECCLMVNKSPQLRRSLTPYDRTGRVIWDEEGGSLEALGADADTTDGINPSGIVIDELHRHKTRLMWDVLALGSDAREQPLLLAITTAGDTANVETSICYEQRDHSEKILRQELEDDEYYAFVAEPDRKVIDGRIVEDDWTQPATWRKGNPSLGVTVFEEQLQAACRRAQQNPSAENSFKRLKLNMWTEQTTRWLLKEYWDACPALSPRIITGKRCFIGFDLSARWDLTAVALIFPPQDGIDIWTVRVQCWCPEDTIEAVQKVGRIPYGRWADDDWLIPTPGNVVDPQQPEDFIRKQGELNHVVEVGYDPWNALATVNNLTKAGFEMVSMRQGVGTLHSPSVFLEKLVLSTQIDHGHNPVFTWSAGNAGVYKDSNENIKPDKSKSSGKIDPIAATVNGLGRALANTDENDPHDTLFTVLG